MNHCKNTFRIILPAVILLIICFLSVSCRGGEHDDAETKKNVVYILFSDAEFDHIAESGKSINDLLPDKINGTDGNGSTKDYPVIDWKQNNGEDFNSEKAGTYIFEPVIVMPENENYDSLPEYTVNIVHTHNVVSIISQPEFVFSADSELPDVSGELSVSDEYGNLFTASEYTVNPEAIDPKTVGEYLVDLSSELYEFSDMSLINVKIVHSEPVKAEIEDNKISLSVGSVPSLPTEVPAEDEYGNEFSINIEWTCSDFNSNKSGTYTFSGNSAEYPELKIPEIKIVITAGQIKISGLERNSLVPEDGEPNMKISVSNPGTGKAIFKLQKLSFGEWIDVSEFSAKAGKTSHTLDFGDDLWKDAEPTKWRIYAPKTDSTSTFEYTFTVEYDCKPYAPSEGYYAPSYEPYVLTSGDYNLTNGVMGLKVYRVQKALGMGKPYGYYQSETISNVKSFQKERGLDQTGIVDKETWLALGLDENEWDQLGVYVHPLEIQPDYSRSQMIDTFIKTAESYLKTRYIVGASGKPGEGADCSGLVLQCMYSIGIYPDVANPVQHSVEEEYDSLVLWQDEKLMTIDGSDLRIGDLVFYNNKKDKARPIDHIAIYIGGGKCIEAWSKTEILDIDKTKYGYEIVGYKRVIR